MPDSHGLSPEDIHRKWTGDYDGMVRDRIIRALVPMSRTFYFIDNGHQRGLTFEALKLFERFVNKRERTGNIRIHLVIIPTPRDRLLENLRSGLGDMAAGNLTITAQRSRLVDFCAPFLTGVDEIIATRAGEPELKSLSDLSGREVYVRKSSSYFESLERLNRNMAREGKAPVKIVIADPYLEDEDLLEMMNAGILPAIVIDSHKGKLWAGIFKKIRLYPDIKLHTGGKIAWAIRKNCPGLKKVINEFVRKNRKGTLTGNILYRKYLENTEYLKNNQSRKELKKFIRVIDIFRKYAQKYDFDWLMLTALAYQESQLDNSRRSRAGAVGIMQVLPSTAADPNVGISGIENLENNIHAGTKYLRFMVDRYFADEKMSRLDKGLFAFASYNAGPARIAGLRRQAAREGLNPDVWFNNVEIIAAEKIGSETVQYVRNIYKYYVAYSIIDRTGKLKEIKKALIMEHHR